MGIVCSNSPYTSQSRLPRPAPPPGDGPALGNPGRGAGEGHGRGTDGGDWRAGDGMVCTLRSIGSAVKVKWMSQSGFYVGLGLAVGG